MSGEENTAAELVEALRRWQEAGGTWRGGASSAAWASAVLLRCDGGEEVGRLASGDPAWLEFIASASSREPGEPPGQSTTEDTWGTNSTDQNGMAVATEERLKINGASKRVAGNRRSAEVRAATQ